MFEPLTLTLAELAVRWNLTPRQVLQQAQQPGVPLYFAFEGLVFDIGDQWHRHGGNWLETRERDALVKSVESGEAWLRRRRDGRLTEWDQLSEEEAQELRAEIEEDKIKIRDLNKVLADRDAERNRRHFRGFLRAAPATLWDIESLGAAPFPHKAFHPSSPVKLVRLLSTATLEGGWIWDGRLVALEPMYEKDPHWKKRLTADDLIANTTEVKAIEAMMRAKETSATATTSASTRNGDDPVERHAQTALSSRLRQKPAGGDALTPTIWDICYDLSDASEKVTAGTVMRELKIRAQSTDPKVRGALLCSTAGGVKWETAINGDEKELFAGALDARIKEWRKAQP